MNKLYTDLNFPGCYSGAYNLKKVTKGKVSKKEFNKFILNSRTLTLYKKRYEKFPRLKTIGSGFLSHIQIDLADYQKLKQYNNQYTFCLVATDVLSRRIFVAPLKSKKTRDVQDGMEKILADMPFKPIYIFSDRGTDIDSKQMHAFYKKHSIIKTSARNTSVKAALVERSILTIKQRLYRYFTEKNTLNWVDVIEKLVSAINKSPNRGINNRKPNEIDEKNQQEVFEELYNSEEQKPYKSKLKLGDYVRVQYKKGIFEKSYLANYSDQIHKIIKCHRTTPPVYTIANEAGEALKERFYAKQLVKVEKNQETTYRVEKVLRSRINKNGVKEFLVKWVGFPSSFNSYVAEKDFVN